MIQSCAAIVIAAKHHELTKVKDTRGTTHTVGALRCRFEFRTTDWDYSAKTAMFCNGDAILHPEVADLAIAVPLDEDNECAVPYEVLTDTLPYSIGVWGVTPDGLRIVSRWLVFGAQPGCYTDGNAPADPEPTIYEQILTTSQGAMNIANEVLNKVNNGELDGKSAYELACDEGYKGTQSEWIESLGGIQGERGVGITDVTRIATNNNIDTYQIVYTDGNSTTFNITNGVDGSDGVAPHIGTNGNWWLDTVDMGVKAVGSDGKKGEKGESGADGKDGVDGKTPYIKDGFWWISDTNTNVRAEGTSGAQGEKGDTGENGIDGADGVGIAMIEKASTDGAVDTYVITLTNGVTHTFTITNGVDGKDGEPGAKGDTGTPGVDGLTPFIGENNNWWIGDADTGIKATGDKGDAGVVKFIVVNELPTENIENAIYLIPSVDTEDDNSFEEYIYVDGAWEKIGSASVAVNLDEYVKFTDYATKEKAGVVRVSTNGHPNNCYGVMMSSIDKNLTIRRATNDIIAARTPSDYIDAGQTKADRTMPICPANLDYAVVQVLTNYKGEALTDEEKAAALNLLGGMLKPKNPARNSAITMGDDGKINTAQLVHEGATSWSVPCRDDSGCIKTATPIADLDAANKKYVDDAIGDISSALDELHTYAQSLIGGNAE